MHRLQGRRSTQDLDRTTTPLPRLPGHRNHPLNPPPRPTTQGVIPMTHTPPSAPICAAAAAHPGRSPPSPRNTSPRPTGAPSSTARRACANSPKQTETHSASPNTPNSRAGWSRSPLPAAAPTPSTCPARQRLWIRQRARSSATTTPAPNPANGSPSAAATGERVSAPPAHDSTRATPTTSSARASSAARTSLPPSATALASSSL